MLRSHPTGRRLASWLAVLTTAVAVPVLAPALLHADSTAPISSGAGPTGPTGPSTNTEDPNNYTCVGHIQRGAVERGVKGTQVEYQFSCDGPITGYVIEAEPHRIRYFDQAPLVALAGVPAVNDAFACSAFLPGFQINCVGSTAAALEVITGQFVIAEKALCAEPRLDPILTVTQATATATIGGPKAAPTASATVTQSLAGPYDLGRPWGCPGDRYGANTRLGSRPPHVVLSGSRRSATQKEA